MARIRDTAIYKNTVEFVKPLTRNEYAHELSIARRSKKALFTDDAFSLAGAFVWAGTLQDIEYWSAVSSIIDFNKENQNVAH